MTPQELAIGLPRKALLLRAETPWFLSLLSSSAPKDPGEGLPVNDAADIQGFSIFFLGFYRFIFVRLNRIVGSHVLKFGSVTGLMVP